MTNTVFSASNLHRSVAEARRQLLRRELLQIDVTPGTALSYPVPRQSTAGVVLGHFLYGSPVVSSARLLSRPRFWLLTAPRETKVLLFADCRVQDFTPDGYADATWPRPEAPAASVLELQTMEQQLLSSLDAFLDEAFAEPASLSSDARTALAAYIEMIHRLTPEPMAPFLHAISPEFWDWATAVRSNNT